MDYRETGPNVGKDGKPYKTIARTLDGIRGPDTAETYIARYHYFEDDPVKSERYRATAIEDLERDIAQRAGR